MKSTKAESAALPRACGRTLMFSTMQDKTTIKKDTSAATTNKQVPLPWTHVPSPYWSKKASTSLSLRCGGILATNRLRETWPLLLLLLLLVLLPT